MYTVYGDIQSGNCYKIKLLMNLLELEHRWLHVDILKGESRRPEYLAKNPNGKIPLLELDDGRCLVESNAILNYLAEGSEFLPADRYLHAQVLGWQFFEQYSHEPFIAVARYIEKYLGLPEDQHARYEATRDGGYKALAVMEQRLVKNDWLVDCGFSIADISLYAYTHVANEGGFSLDDFPGIVEWIGRIGRQPRHISMAKHA